LEIFLPRKHNIDLNKFEGKGIQYSIVDPNKFKGKKFIAGEGILALVWLIVLLKDSDNLKFDLFEHQDYIRINFFICM
tara:strand:- start:22 stop:255 length:234 start_codon:yes stop_codon:yes gene_type:complete